MLKNLIRKFNLLSESLERYRLRRSALGSRFHVWLLEKENMDNELKAAEKDLAFLGEIRDRILNDKIIEG